MPRLEQGLSTRQAQPVTHRFESSWLGAFLTRLMDPKTGKKKFRAIKRHRPAEGCPAHGVVAAFIDQQEQLLLLLRQAVHMDVNGVRIPLSISPWLHLPIGDVLQFLVAHTERHIVQANRNLPSA